MILLLAIVAGLLAGLAWTGLRNRPYQAPPLRSIWLVFAAFIPQLTVAYLPATRHLLPDWLAKTSLLASMVLFLAFVWINRQLPGMPILLLGLMLNLIVMSANGGWMPIGPRVASHLTGTGVLQSINPGVRFGQKDILLPPQDTHFEFLADRFLLPAWFPYQVAFSVGDTLIALGVFWLLAKPATSTNFNGAN